MNRNGHFLNALTKFETCNISSCGHVLINMEMVYYLALQGRGVILDMGVIK